MPFSVPSGRAADDRACPQAGAGRPGTSPSPGPGDPELECRFERGRSARRGSAAEQLQGEALGMIGSQKVIRRKLSTPATGRGGRAAVRPATSAASSAPNRPGVEPWNRRPSRREHRQERGDGQVYAHAAMAATKAKPCPSVRRPRPATTDRAAGPCKPRECRASSRKGDDVRRESRRRVRPRRSRRDDEQQYEQRVRGRCRSAPTGRWTRSRTVTVTIARGERRDGADADRGQCPAPARAVEFEEARSSPSHRVRPRDTIRAHPASCTALVRRVSGPGCSGDRDGGGDVRRRDGNPEASPAGFAVTATLLVDRRRLAHERSAPNITTIAWRPVWPPAASGASRSRPPRGIGLRARDLRRADHARAAWRSLQAT